MKNYSIWLDSCHSIPKYPSLKKDIKTDILIIGGGITGLSCAYFLKDSPYDVTLIEANQIATGTTSKSTGKLTYLQDNIYKDIYDNYNLETAQKYYQSQVDAIKLAKNIICEHNIDCNLETAISYTYTTKYNNIFKLNDNYKIIKNFAHVKLKDKIPIKEKCCKSIECNDTYVFNPYKFCLGLAKIVSDKVSIYEKTRITNIKYDTDNNTYHAETSKHVIHATKVILACHYPFFLFPYLFPIKTGIEKSFLVASQIDKDKYFSAINIDKDITSLRYYHDKNKYLILVSESGTLSQNIDNIYKRDNAIWKMRSKFATNIKYCWSNHDIKTSDKLPLIGQIKDNLYLATGYNTWGMTNGILAGKIISDLINDIPNSFTELFAPHRDEKDLPQALMFNLENSLSLINSKLNKNKKFYGKDVKIFKENGITYGLYIDENKKEHKVLNTCPHLKCSLTFNYQTKTWDCPCHGSSFDIDGNVIYGPSKENIKIKKDDD